MDSQKINNNEPNIIPGSSTIFTDKLGSIIPPLSAIDIEEALEFGEQVVQWNTTDKLKVLLHKFDLEFLEQRLKDFSVTYERLQYLSKEDIKEIFPEVGLRAEFREKLFFWKKQTYGIDEIVTIEDKISDWFKRNQSVNSPLTLATTSTLSNTHTKLSKDLKSLLKESDRGILALNYQENNGCLNEIHRKEIVAIIAEDVFKQNILLSPKDFLPIVNQQILPLFPKEESEYYFIPRNKENKNPGGKLYSKIYNARAKKRRSEKSEADALDSSLSKQLKEEQEIDITILTSLKT